MTKDNYINEVMKHVKQFLPDEQYRVSSTTTMKNNGVELNGIVINSNKSNFAPVIYIDRMMSEGHTPEEAAIQVMNQFRELKEQEVPFSVSDLTDFNSMQDRICFRLINKDNNKKLLESVPFSETIDGLAVVYFIALSDNQTITVNHNIADMWNVTDEDLYKLASANMPQLYPPKLRSMSDVMLDMMDMDMMKMEYGKNQMSDEAFRDFVKEKLFGDSTLPLYVLAGRDTFGASAVLYDNILPIIQAQMGDVYMIPSSCHELLIVSVEDAERYGMTVKDIKNMVQEVNATSVAPEDYLSDNVYEITEAGIFIAEDRGVQNVTQEDIR